MMSSLRSALYLVAIILPCLPAARAESPPRPSKEALRAFNDLIGSWRGTGLPAGTRAEQEKGFWTEGITWQWQFKGTDAWLKITFDKSKHFTGGTLRYVPKDDAFSLTLQTPAKESLTFVGSLKNKVLTAQRKTKDETQRLVITLLHPNRFLYRYETAPLGKTFFARKYSVGATKQGVAFAGGDGGHVCVVSGGQGTIPVVYMGKTYYVCCGGCRDEFRENPAKYIKEFESKQKAK